MKARIKQFIIAHASVAFLLPAGQYVLGLPYKLRNILFREILRLRLFGLWLVKRRPLLVFSRFGGIGDILCSLPAYAALCRNHPEMQGVFITLTEFKSLPGLAQAPGLVCASRLPCALPKLPRWLVAQAFTPHYTDELGQQSSQAHLVDEFFRASGLALVADASPRFSLSSDQVGKIRESLQIRSGRGTKTVVIHVGPSWKVREWPVAHWQALVDGLHASVSVRILQIGAHRHVNLGKVETPVLRGVESLVGQLSLEDMAALLAVADLFIGIDSGMIHMAGAAGTACVGIFGPTNPAFRMLRSANAVGLAHALPCSFCHHRQPRLHFRSGCPNGIACMNLLKPELVLEQSQSLLETADAV